MFPTMKELKRLFPNYDLFDEWMLGFSIISKSEIRIIRFITPKSINHNVLSSDKKCPQIKFAGI
jgi:hypothetical protein